MSGVVSPMATGSLREDGAAAVAEQTLIDGEAHLGVLDLVAIGLPAQLPDDLNVLIKRADKASAYFEATQLAGFSVEEALEFFGSPRGLRQVKLVPLAARDAQAAYVARFNELLPSPSDS
jgi:hypothetical protein